VYFIQTRKREDILLLHCFCVFDVTFLEQHHIQHKKYDSCLLLCLFKHTCLQEEVTCDVRATCVKLVDKVRMWSLDPGIRSDRDSLIQNFYRNALLFHIF
jgi:hypothetical protein